MKESFVLEISFKKWSTLLGSEWEGKPSPKKFQKGRAAVESGFT
jgi:hypothetical protein